MCTREESFEIIHPYRKKGWRRLKGFVIFSLSLVNQPNYILFFTVDQTHEVLSIITWLSQCANPHVP